MSSRYRRSPSGPSITPRYREIQGEIFRSSGVNDFTFQPFRDTPYSMFFCRHDQNDLGNFRYAMEQDWDGSPVEFFSRVVPVGAGSGNVVFDGYYLWTSVEDGAMPALASWTSFRNVVAITAADQYRQKRVTLFTSTPGAAFRTKNTSLLIYLRRPGAADSADTYTASNPDGIQAANLGFVATRIRYRINSLGSL